MNIETLQFDNLKFQNLFEVMGILDHYEVTGIYGNEGSIEIVLADDAVVNPVHVHFLNNVHGAFNQKCASTWELQLD